VIESIDLGQFHQYYYSKNDDDDEMMMMMMGINCDDRYYEQ